MKSQLQRSPFIKPTRSLRAARPQVKRTEIAQVSDNNPIMSESDSNSLPAEPASTRLRLPHWGWFLLSTVILAVGFVGLSIWLPYRRERQVIQRIEGRGGRVTTERFAPEWLQKTAGEDRMKEMDVFERVSRAELHGAAIGDAEIADLKALANLRRLSLHGTEVTDAGLAQLSALATLKSLDLSKTAVTDAGMAHLSGLRSLEGLDLHATAITDAGLTHLGRLKNLRILHLDSTSVTDEGIASLKRALPNCDFIR